jgi:hypothetical protein
MGCLPQKSVDISGRYQRLAPRIGHKRAIVAVAHGLLLTVLEVLRSNEPYSGLGADRIVLPANSATPHFDGLVWVALRFTDF